MDASFTRKIMIDSRFRKSGTPGSFSFELSRAITLPTKCAGFVTDIELLHSWYTIDDHNEFFYFREEYGTNYISDTDFTTNHRVHRVALDKRNYTATELATELEGKMNEVLKNAARQISVTYNAGSGTMTFALVNGTPSIEDAADTWTRLTGLSHETETPHVMTVNASDPNTLDFTSGGNPATLVMVSYHDGPDYGRRLSFTETINGSSHTFTWDSSLELFVSTTTSARWEASRDFHWLGVYPATTFVHTVLAYINDQELLYRGPGSWWTYYNIPGSYNDNRSIPYDNDNPRTINYLLGNLPAEAYCGPLLTQTFETNFLNLLGESVPLYITSPSLTSFGTSMGPRGEHIIVRKINAKAPFGQVIVDILHTDQDYFMCGGSTIKTIQINLVNSFGHKMNLQADWSLSIVFQQME